MVRDRTESRIRYDAIQVLKLNHIHVIVPENYNIVVSSFLFYTSNANLSEKDEKDNVKAKVK